MEQQIRYCTTSDGVRIAYATAGQGPPLVIVPGWMSHLQYTWEEPARSFWEKLAQHRRLVRYDGRGMGLSDREVDDLSFESRLRDLETVIAALEAESFDLMGMSEGGPTSIAYAARHPDKLQHLILYGSYPRSPVRPQDARALLPLIRDQWGMGSAALTAVFVPKGEPEYAADFTRLQRMAATGDVAARTLEEILKTDVTALLTDVSVPTLVVHRQGDRIHPLVLARELAASIPNALFELLEGDAYPPWVGDSAAVARAITSFIGAPATEEVLGGPVPASALVITLFTDITSSTALTQRLGDALAQELVRAHNAIVRDALKAHSGTEIKHTGDGIMASFPAASSALACAVAIQRAVEARDPPPATRDSLRVHIGLNAGEPIAEDADLFGISVQLARRVCDHAESEQILVSNVVKELAAGKGFLFADNGEVALKGFEDPVRLYEVRWRKEPSSGSSTRE